MSQKKKKIKGFKKLTDIKITKIKDVNYEIDTTIDKYMVDTEILHKIRLTLNSKVSRLRGISYYEIDALHCLEKYKVITAKYKTKNTTGIIEWKYINKKYIEENYTRNNTNTISYYKIIDNRSFQY